MSERKGFTFRDVTSTERRTVAVRLTLLLALLASCLTFASAVSAQIWHSNLEVGADLIAIPGTGCGIVPPSSCHTQLSNQSFRFDGETYEIVIVALQQDELHVVLYPDWPRELLVEPWKWKVCVNSTAFSLKDASPNMASRSWHDPSLTWEIGDSVRLAITSDPCS